MASRSMQGRRKTFGVDQKEITLRIFPDAASAPTFTASDGVASVGLQATGLFRITLEDPYRALVAAHATYCASANNVDLYPQFQAFTNLGTSTATVVDLALKTGATNTNAPAANAANFICVTLVFEDSSARTP